MMLSDNADAQVDAEINVCLNLDHPRSFFLFAGAGSGKTFSLVAALKRFRDENGPRLKLQRRRVGVITYTNAACDEITQRLQYDPLVEVSTIHSFIWNLIKNLNADIKQWVEIDLRRDIEELSLQQSKGRASSAAFAERVRRLESKQRRLMNLPSVKQFTYSPTGDFRGRDALNHAEVIKIGAEFLTQRPMMQNILVNRYPVLLIDESQDTNKLLMDAFLQVQSLHRERFALGLFGDMMQRIYTDGKEGLGENLPPDWATPAKAMNHRCPKRVVQLINQIRSSVDAQVQRPRTDKEEGFVRLFVLPSDTQDKPAAERAIRETMAKITGDPQWREPNAVKTLMLEHLMAARRMGFLELFWPLYEAGGGVLQTSLREGTLPGLKFFSDVILPLHQASVRQDEFAVAAIVRERSPLLSQLAFKVSMGNDQTSQIRRAQAAVAALNDLWSAGSDPSLGTILGCVRESGLFEIPEGLELLTPENDLSTTTRGDSKNMTAIGDEHQDSVLVGWEKALQAPFSQVERYSAYVRGEAPFGTHQGIKGLEFPRVLVVMDDEEARGFLFSYDKLFGAAPKSPGDLKNEQLAKETSLDRTRRLLYVTCSRAERSLALIAYSVSPSNVRDHALREGWFEDNEIVEVA
jgi:DNA helicase-2/ATP-dependent DNA helicase PcrA